MHLSVHNTTQCQIHFEYCSLYATFAFAVAVALVVVVDARFTRGWQVPDRVPEVKQTYPTQQETVTSLHEAREDNISTRRT